MNQADVLAPSPSTMASAPSGEGHALIRRVRFLSAMAVSVTIFWHVGRWAASPADPAAPITLMGVDQGVIAMAELLGLGVIASGLAMAICGPGSADRGALAIAIGLAALGLRGTQLDSFVLYRLGVGEEPGSDVSAFPAVALVAETWLWLALIAVGFVVGKWVQSWFEAEGSRGAAATKSIDQPPDIRQGLGAIAVVSLVAWLIVSYAMGDEANPLLKGQIYFCVGMAFLIGSMMANWLFRLHSRVWLLVSVALVATAAYLFAGPDAPALAAASQKGTYLVLRSVVRPLPIEYAALGAVGVLLENDAARMLRALFGLQPVEAR